MSGEIAPHVEESIRAVEELHVEHRERATPVERMIEHLRAGLSHPGFLLAVILIVAVWITWGLSMHGSSWVWDPPPFGYLQLTLSIVAVCVAILILAAQRRTDQLIDHRERLILLESVASEQKAAKIVALLEELRRDSPHVKDRVDQEAEQMTEVINPRAVSDALRESGSGSTKEPRKT